MLYLLFFSGAIVFRNSNMLLYLLLSTGSNIPGTLTCGDVVVSAVVYGFQYFQELSPLGGVAVPAVVNMFQYFQELSPLGDVAVAAVVHMFQYLQGLLPGGDVVVSAVVCKFQYFQELSPLSAVVLILSGENFLGSPVFLSKNNKTLHIEIAGKKSISW